jgi:hypothetical protein
MMPGIYHLIPRQSHYLRFAIAINIANGWRRWGHTSHNLAPFPTGQIIAPIIPAKNTKPICRVVRAVIVIIGSCADEHLRTAVVVYVIQSRCGLDNLQLIDGESRQKLTKPIQGINGAATITLNPTGQIGNLIGADPACATSEGIVKIPLVCADDNV